MVKDIEGQETHCTLATQHAHYRLNTLPTGSARPLSTQPALYRLKAPIPTQHDPTDSNHPQPTQHETYRLYTRHTASACPLLTQHIPYSPYGLNTIPIDSNRLLRTQHAPNQLIMNLPT